MNLDSQLLFFFSALGVFNGFLVSLYFLFFTNQKRLSNYFLGFLLLMLSIRIGKSVMIIFLSGIPKLYLQIGLSSCFLIGPALLFYLKSSLDNVTQLSQKWKIHIAFLLIIIFSVGIIFPYATATKLWTSYIVKIIYLQWIIYVIASGFVLRSLFKKIIDTTRKLSTTEIWLISLYIGNVIICASYMYGFYKYYIIGPLSFSFVFYALTFFLLFKKNRAVIFTDTPTKYASKKIETTEAKALLEQLEKLMLEKKLHTNPNIKLKDIAKELSISAHRLSQLLNDNLKKSFSVFINEHRTQEAKELIKKNDQFTLEAIGYDAGFSSKSSFYSTFKKITGLTPSQYKKQLD